MEDTNMPYNKNNCPNLWLISDDYCPAVWDTVTCWPATPAGHVVFKGCPPLRGIDPKRKCLCLMTSGQTCFIHLSNIMTSTVNYLITYIMWWVWHQFILWYHTHDKDGKWSMSHSFTTIKIHVCNISQVSREGIALQFQDKMGKGACTCGYSSKKYYPTISNSST